MITTFYPPYHFGGDGIFTHRLANELARRGHQVDVIHCRDAYRLLADAPAPADSYPNHPNVRVHGLKSIAGPLSPLLTHQTGYPLLKGSKIQRILEERDFDVIHFHNISLVGGPKVLEYGDALKLYTLHEYWLICPTHVLFKNNEKACEEPHCFSCTLRHKRPPQLWRYTDMLEEAVQHVDAFIASSEFSAEMHERRGLSLPTVQIPMFIPDPLSESGEDLNNIPHPNEGRPYFLFVGRLEKLKGLQDVIPVFDRYDQADLLIAGDGDYRSELERLVGDNDRIKFLGMLPYAELRSLYSHALALLVPSLCYETFGQIVLEVFSMKTPVIARDIGALREIVQESGGGMLFRTEDELREAMETLQADPQKRSELSRQGYATYQQQGTVDYFLDRYLSLVDELQEKPQQVVASSS